MATRLYVGNLSYATTEDELRSLFEQAGRVTSIHMPVDRATGQPRGFAFVEMGSTDEANEAIRKFDGYTLGNRQIRVNEAREREEHGGRGGRY